MSVRVRDLRSESSLLDALALARKRFGLSGWVLYPTRDENVAALAANRDMLARDFRVPTPGLASIRHVWDKRETYRLAEQLSIPIPRTWFPRSEADVAAIDVSCAAGREARHQGALLLHDSRRRPGARITVPSWSPPFAGLRRSSMTERSSYRS